MTGPKLFAGRWNVARTNMLEFIEQPAQIRARCSLPGWLQRLEITVKAKSKMDAYDRYYGHHGHGMAIFDTYGVRPILDGWVYEVVPDGRHVTYIVGGGWKRMTDQTETTPPATASTGTADYLKSVLTAHAPAISSNHDDIDATGTAIGHSFQLRRNTGSTPQEIAEYVAAVGTSQDYILDFWVQGDVFKNVQLQKPLPFLKARKTEGEYRWQVRLRDLAEQSFARHIWELINYVQIYFTWTTQLNGAASAGATALTVDSIANFAVGDEVEIQLDNDRTFRASISARSGTTLTINEDLPHSAPDDGVIYRRDPLQDSSAAQDSSSQSRYWTRQYRIVEADILGNYFSQSQANQIRDGYLADLKAPIQQASFTIGAGRVRSAAGAIWPTWRMLHAPSYIRINDLFPTAALVSLALDAQAVFFTQGMDYDHNARRLRITPDAFFGDNRIDVLMQRLGLKVGQAVLA